MFTSKYVSAQSSATSLFMESLMGTDTIFERTNTQHTVGNKFKMYAGLFTAQPSFGESSELKLEYVLLEVPLPVHG